MQARVRVFIAFGMLLVTLAACSSITPTTIQKIRTNPRDYADKEVTISGTVADSFSLVVVKYFLIDDGTGQMAVVTQKSMPVKGTKVKVTGTLQDVFSLGDQQLLVLIEGGDLNLSFTKWLLQ